MYVDTSFVPNSIAAGAFFNPIFIFAITIPTAQTVEVSFKVNVKSYVNCTFRNPKAPVPTSTIKLPVFERNIEQ